MTAADLKLAQYPEDLPSLASDWRVTVTFDLCPDVLGACEVCTLEDYDRDPEQATMRLTYQQWDDVASTTDVCDVAHADQELEWLLKCSPVDGYPRNIRLQVPPSWAAPVEVVDLPVADTDSDPEFILYDSLLRFIRTLPNSATVDMSGRDGFDHARNTLLGHVSQLGLHRIQELERRVA